jgi:hypothetical protein
MKSSEIIKLAITLVVSALGIIYSQSMYYACILIIISMIFIAYIVIRNHKAFFMSYYYIYFPHIISDRDDAFNAFIDIYKEAGTLGGLLIATQIGPKVLIPSKDEAIELLKNVNNNLEYRRFIFMDNKLLESQWIKNSLNCANEKVQMTVYYIKTSLNLPNSIWSIIPRANLLLYKRDNYSICMLGLDKLQTHDKHYENTNFGIILPGKVVFNVLNKYFESITANPFVGVASSITQYLPSQEDLGINPSIQSVINDLSVIANYSDLIYHIGIFGKTALQLKGVIKLEDWEEHESDIDIMIIVKRGFIEDIKNRINKIFISNKEIDIVWGDDDNYFYHFRNTDKLTLDIEIRETKDNYYNNYQLLGCSIFSCYYTLFIRNGYYLYNLLEIPFGFKTSKERFLKLLNDRKGLIDFQKRLKVESTIIDPRRIISLCLKNISWAISGNRPNTTNISISFLTPIWNDIFPDNNIDTITNMLKSDRSEIKHNYIKYINIAKSIVIDCINYTNANCS